jgi:exodeoxyribonuclease-3
MAIGLHCPERDSLGKRAQKRNGPRVRLGTWNVNSLRIRENAVLDWTEDQRPDVLCLQETKMTDQEFPEDAFGDLGYDAAFWGQRSYNGVAIVSGPEMRDVQKGLPGDGPEDEKRLLGATIEGVRIYSIYAPNGQQVDSDRYRFKLEWFKRLKRFLEENHAPNDPLLLLGDFNVAPTDADVYDPAAVRGQLLASEPERAAFSDLCAFGLLDAFRHFDTRPKRFTWWDYRSSSWERNLGLRIDHILVTRPILDRAKAITIFEEERGKPQPSDHVPLAIELSD